MSGNTPLVAGPYAAGRSGPQEAKLAALTGGASWVASGQR